jgi:3-oxoacyl-[acyl-carrier-protein] synthase-3
MPKQSSVNKPDAAGIARLACALPEHCYSLEELAVAGKLQTSPEVLRSFGFETAFIACSSDELFDLELKVARELIEGIDNPAEQIDSLIVYHGVEQYIAAEPDSPLAPFRYTTSRLQFELALSGVPFRTFSQQGCNGLLSALRLGQRLLATSAKRYLAIISSDRLPGKSPREIIHNIMSDSAGGVLLDRQSPRMRIVAHHEINQPYYWNTPEREVEVLAAYFPLAKRVIEETLEKHRLQATDIRWIVPHNVSTRSWEILADIVGFPLEKVWLGNVARTGHTVSTDHLINLHDMQEQGALTEGDRLLLFSFGFGAGWAAQIMEY